MAKNTKVKEEKRWAAAGMKKKEVVKNQAVAENHLVAAVKNNFELF